MSGPRKGRHQLARLMADLSERDRDLVQSVSHLRLATTRQLERLHFAAPERHATTLTAARTSRRTLERLVRDRLLLRLQRRIGGVRAGSASFIYALGPVGERVLALDGPRRRFREPSAWFVVHTLAVSELYVRVHEAARAGNLSLLGDIETEPRCWRNLTTLNGRLLLKPDLFVAVGSGGYEYRWFIEVDLGTEHAPAIVRKCRAYEAYYRSGKEQVVYDVFPRVLWVAPGQDRAEAIRAAISRTPDLTDGLFVVTTDDQTMKLLVGGNAFPTSNQNDNELNERRNTNGTNY